MKFLGATVVIGLVVCALVMQSDDPQASGCYADCGLHANAPNRRHAPDPEDQ